jgi:2,6-dihydroxypseudooxynicotine hydrolase
MTFEAEVSYQRLIAQRDLVYRFVGQGLDLEVVEETIAAVGSQSDWLPEWMKTGERYMQLAEDALERQRNVTAAGFLIKAVLAHHFAQFLHFGDIEEKHRAQRAKLDVHARARPLLTPPIARMEVAFDGVSLPVHVRLPAGPGPHPAVILICGTDSTKEENLVTEDHLLARGLAVAAFDGPGQGETWPHMKMRPDYHRAVSAVADAVGALPVVDAKRMMLLGKSFGGFLAPQAAASDGRFVACVANGGYFDTEFYDWSDPLRAVRFQFVLGARTVAEAREMAKSYTLSPSIKDLDTPLLVIHGGRDRGVPTAVARRIAEEARGPAHFIEFPTGIHCCHNIAYRVNTLTADWLAEQARAAAALTAWSPSP